MAKFPVLLRNVENSLLKMKDIISDLVQSRWQDKRYQAHEELLDLQNILEDVRLTLAPQLKEADAVLTFEIGASEITFARRKLRSVLYNLVSNALKYSDELRIPKILIKSSIRRGFMVIMVSDNGIGIDKKQLRSIFNKYHRVSTEVEGNGVGLYLVKQILETAGGRIEVKSTPGVGSVFSVFLPLAVTEA